MNEKKNPLISTVAAAKELRKVPGFDPLKHLRTVTKDGEKVLKLDLRFKKLWFRLACPQGRMLLNPLRITDQMAIFEARVYASKDDPTPLASFTSTQMARNVPGGLYIRAAQDEALNEALDNAGFGIQLCDVAQVSDGSGFGSEIPLSQVDAAKQTSAPAGEVASEPPAEVHQETETPMKPPIADTAPPPVQPEVQHNDATTPQNIPAAPVEEVAGETSVPQEPAQDTGAPIEEPVETTPNVETPTPVEEETVPTDGETVPAEEETAPQAEVLGAATPQPQTNVTPLPVAPSPETETPGEAATPEEASLPAGDTAAQGGYTEDMTVEEICERMTLEEAQNILVPLGTCKGWTLGQVLDRRPTSLRWYVVGCKDADNVLKAGASLLWNIWQQQKAS